MVASYLAEIGYTPEQQGRLHEMWKDAEALGLPLEKRPKVIQKEPTPYNLRMLYLEGF
jgi:hypothetical protein